MDARVRRLLELMPFLFGLGFIAPLVMMVMARAGINAPFAMSRLGFGLLFGAAWGGLAHWRGRWF